MLAAWTGIALLQWLAKSVMDHALAQSFLDPLTGVHNRGYFDGMLRHYQNHHQYLYPVSVLMADINDLKRVNDAFGHAAGDELIVRGRQPEKSEPERGHPVPDRWRRVCAAAAQDGQPHGDGRCSASC